MNISHSDNEEVLTAQNIAEMAKNSSAKIGIGLIGDNARKNLIIKGAKRHGISEVHFFGDASTLVEALSAGKIDAAVRGNLEANNTMSSVRRFFSLDKILRAALLQPPKGNLILLAPVGVDEGWTLEQKIELIDLGMRFLTRLGIEPKVGILSGGRKGDRGRHPVVDRTLDEAEAIAEYFRESKFDVKDCEILIENAVLDRNMILAPDGISGNLIFRALHFLGGWRALGAPILNLEKVFIDTSRAKRNYVDSIALAAALVKLNKGMR
ncbi:MAG: methanogenesis marker protein Mmp4/MtxX [Methanomassiliicoccales archaeon]